MEANTQRFKTASFPCDFDSCPSGSDSSAEVDAASFGPGSTFRIDSTKPFTVETRFFGLETTDGSIGDLDRIETCLIQGTEMITIAQTNADYLAPLREKL